MTVNAPHAPDPGSRKEQLKHQFLEYLLATGRVGKAAKRSGISVLAVEAWRREDPDFDAEIKAAGQMRSWVDPDGDSDGATGVGSA